MNLQVDFKDPAVMRDPFPALMRLQAEEPLHRNHSLGGWVVTRFQDVLAILRNPEDYSSDRMKSFNSPRNPEMQGAVQEIVSILGEFMVFSDPPKHSRARKLLHPHFTATEVEKWRPRIQRIVDDLLERITARESADLIAEYTYPLPATVICSMMDVPISELDNIKVWSDHIAAFIASSTDPQRYPKARDALRGMVEFFRELCARRRKSIGDDLVSLLITSNEDGDKLSEEEVIVNCILLLFAGHETTTNLIGNGIYHLLRFPDQMRRLREDPELIRPAVEEFLRYEGPALSVVRIATRDVNLLGRELTQGSVIFPFLGAANRDPREFPNPETLDITRRPNHHLAFGRGIHFCLGGPWPGSRPSAPSIHCWPAWRRFP